MLSLQLDPDAPGPPAAVQPAQGQDLLAQVAERQRRRAAAAVVAGRDGLTGLSEAGAQPVDGARRQPQGARDGLGRLSLLGELPDGLTQGGRGRGGARPGPPRRHSG